MNTYFITLLIQVLNTFPYKISICKSKTSIFKHVICVRIFVEFVQCLAADFMEKNESEFKRSFKTNIF